MIDDDAIQQLVNMHAVYRMFGSRGDLLYVGMSGGLGSRLNGHDEKRWFPQVKTITLEWFPTEDEARAAETQAIRAEHPRYNIVHRQDRMPRRRIPVAAILREAAEITLVEAVAAGILGPTLQAVRKASTRNKNFPAPVGQRGPERLYNADELRAYRARRKKDVAL